MATNGNKFRLNQTATDSNKRENNGLGGLIKKIRGNSQNPDSHGYNNDSSLGSSSAGIIKKQTPISDRRNNNDKPQQKYTNNIGGFQSVRERIENGGASGSVTPHHDNSFNNGGYSSIGSPENGAIRTKNNNISKWSNPLTSSNGVPAARKGSNSHVGSQIQ